MTNIIMTIAIVVLTVAICVLAKKQSDVEKELDMMGAEPADIQLDNLEMQMARANDEINAIIARLEEISEDIGRMDQISKQDRARVIEITRKYVNYREPIADNAGVPWASKYKCNEEEEHE